MSGPMSIITCIFLYLVKHNSIYDVMCMVQLVINYVSEHQSPHAVNASHTTLTIHVNRHLMLFKLIGWSIVFVLDGFCTYQES